MKKKLLLGSVVLATTLISGCAVKTGNEKLADATDESITSTIQNGTTTKSEVKSKLGEPTQVDFLSNGLEKWVYTHTLKVEKGINYVPVANWFVRGTNDTKKTLVVLFENDVVKTHTFSTADGETMGGLVR